MPTYSGIRATERAAPGAKFRASWGRSWYSRASFFPPSALAAVRAVQEQGPARGFYSVSSPAVSPGDDAIVLDVKTQASWAGTAATLATALDAVIGHGFELTALKLIPARESSSAAAADRETVQARAEKMADANAPLEQAKKFAGGLRSTVLLVGGVALVIAALVYAPQLKAAGRAAGKATRRFTR